MKAAGAIYLGHSALAASIRPYPHFVDVWRMISRTAFTQLRYSAALLAAHLARSDTGVAGSGMGDACSATAAERGCGLAAFGIAAITYLPTLARYGRSRLWALALPLIAVFYMAATVASALNHWRGAGASWKRPCVRHRLTAALRRGKPAIAPRAAPMLDLTDMSPPASISLRSSGAIAAAAARAA